MTILALPGRRLCLSRALRPELTEPFGSSIGLNEPKCSTAFLRCWLGSKGVLSNRVRNLFGSAETVAAEVVVSIFSSDGVLSFNVTNCRSRRSCTSNWSQCSLTTGPSEFSVTACFSESFKLAGGTFYRTNEAACQYC